MALLDSSGNPVRSGSGSAIRSGSGSGSGSGNGSGSGRGDQSYNAAAVRRANAQAAQAKAVADAKAKRDIQSRIAAAEDKAAQADEVNAARVAKLRAADMARDAAAARKVAAKRAADKKAYEKAEAAKAKAKAEGILAKQRAIKAAKDKAADDAAALEREAVVQERRADSQTDVNSTLAESTAAAPVAEVKATSKGLINSFIPDVISESLKGEGNYSPEWVEKNKAAGSKHLENLYNTGQLQRPLSNITDASGNAIGGVANSQDNVAMQEMAANGVEDPQATLSKEVSDGTGLDTSFSGAFRQAVDGADGHNYEGGGGLLKYANDQNAVAADEAEASKSSRIWSTAFLLTIQALLLLI